MYSFLFKSCFQAITEHACSFTLHCCEHLQKIQEINDESRTQVGVLLTICMVLIIDLHSSDDTATLKVEF